VGVAARAVLVTPLSGPLARFGNAGASALALWAEYSGVSLEVIDAYPSASSAMRAAEARRPDVVFGPYGSGPALAAAGASNGVVWNHGGATARLARPKYPRVVNLESPAYRYLAAVLETLAAIDLGEGSQVVIVRGVDWFPERSSNQGGPQLAFVMREGEYCLPYAGLRSPARHRRSPELDGGSTLRRPPVHGARGVGSGC